MTDVMTDPVTQVGARVRVNLARFRGVVSPPIVTERQDQTGEVVSYDASDNTVRVRFDDGDAYWLDPAGLSIVTDEAPHGGELRVGDRVVTESNFLPWDHEGSMGAQLIGISGSITAIDGNEVTVRVDEDCRAAALGSTTLMLHRDSFLREDDLYRLTEERSIVGKRVRIMLPEYEPGITDTMIERVLGEIGVVRQHEDDGLCLVGGLSQGHTDGHSLIVGYHALELVEDDEAPHSGEPEPPRMTYAEAAALLLTLDGLPEPDATVVSQLRDLHTQIEDLSTARATEQSEWEERMERLQERAREVADEERWCPVFDRAMETLGLEGRKRKIEISWSWSQSVRVSYSVDDDEAAGLVASAYEISADDVEIPGHTTVIADINVAASGTIEHDEGECVCDLVTTDMIAYDLSDEMRQVIDNNTSIDMGGVTCGNCN